MMRPFEVVELHEPAEAAIERRATGEVLAAEDHPPVLSESRLLQPLDADATPGRHSD